MVPPEEVEPPLLELEVLVFPASSLDGDGPQDVQEANNADAQTQASHRTGRMGAFSFNACCEQFLSLGDPRWDAGAPACLPHPLRSPL